VTVYVFYADQSRKRRADGVNAAVATGPTEGVARATAEGLIGEPGAFAEYLAVTVSESTPPFIVQGTPPVGALGQTTWPTLTRGGDPLRGS